MMNLRPELKPGTVIDGKFEVLNRLSEGSLGEDLYLGKHLSLSRKIIIKILPQRGNISKEQIERFIQSTKLIASIQHSNILSAYEAGEFNGMYFLVTAYEKGCFLKETLKQRNRLDELESLKIIFELAKALNYAWHKAKVLHRNISPDTILITSDNQAMLTEFDLAKIMTESVKNMTITGFTVGNPMYMSPEQVRGRKDLDCRSDIYCLGIVFYEMLCGKPPFTDDSTVRLMEAQLSGKHTPVWQINPLVSPQCSEIIDKMLKKEREERYANWDKLIEDIQGLIYHETPDAGRTVSEKAHEKSHGHPKPSPYRENIKYSTVSNYFLVFMGIVIVSAITLLFAIYYNPEKNLGDANDISNMLENLENSKSTVTAPKAQGKHIAPAPVQKKTQVQQHREKPEDASWKLVSSFGRETMKNRGNFDSAVGKLEDFKKKYNNAAYRKLADEQISSLKKAKQSAIEAVMKNLTANAMKFAEKKDFQKAINLLAAYNASFAAETAEERMKLAKNFENKASEWAVEKSRYEEKKQEFVNEISSLIIKGQYKAAAANYDVSEFKADDVRKIVEGLASINKTIMESFRKLNGKEIKIETLDEGEKTVKVIVKGDYINLEEKMETALIQRRLDIYQLTNSEKMKHLTDLPPEVKTIFLAVENIKVRKYRDAEKCLDAAGVLKKPLIKQLSMIEEKAKISQE